MSSLARGSAHDRRGSGRASALAGAVLLAGLAPASAQAAGPQLAREPAELDASSSIAYLETRGRAFADHRAGRWEEAARGLAELTRAYRDDGTVWQALGTSLLALRRVEEAAPALERALELGATYPENVEYDLACCAALAGDADRAFAWLERSLAHRFESLPYVQRDGQLAALHADPRWERVVGPAAVEEDDPVRGWRSDLEHLRREIERLHVDGGYAAPLDEVRAAIDELWRRVPELHEARIPPQMQRILRLLGSGHSVVYPVSTRLAPTELPLRFHWFPEGLYVIDALAGHERWIGCRVEAIGRGRAGDFAADLDPIVTRDNPTGVPWFGPKYLQLTAFLLDLEYVDGLDAVPLVLTTPGGERAEPTVEPVPVELANPRLSPPRTVERPPLFLERPEEAFWHRDLGGGLLYVQVNAMRDGEREPIRAYALRLRDELREAGTTDLVLDLRHNNGGDPFLLPELLRTLIAFETSRPDARLYVLIGRRTFSAAQNFLNDVERLTHAVLVGEPSGSRPNMVGETTEVRLPFSGVRLSVGCRLYQDSFPGDARIWVAPHVPVSLGAADYFAGRDPVLETVRALVRAERR